MMKQLVLDIRPDAPPSLENFVAGHNDELVAALHDFATPASSAAVPISHLYLWGPDGSGRSHLLRATVAAAAASGRPARCLAAEEVGDRLPETPGMILAIDDADRLPPSGQIALFNAFNRARANSQRLLLSGAAAPLRLELREDLRTRIGQCLVFELRPLDDEARAAILATLADRRGLKLACEVTDFLLRHGRRDLPSLLSVLDALDAASLERKRAVTLPLLREMMQTGLEI
jgi:DnaA family protein